MSNLQQDSSENGFRASDFRGPRRRKGGRGPPQGCQRVSELAQAMATISYDLHSFNKRREDFVDLRAYNDYLEEVEDISESYLSVPITCHLTFLQLSI